MAGIVGDISALDASAGARSAIAADTRATFDANWLATLRARLGLRAGGGLWHVTGGVADSEVTTSAFDDASVIGPGIMQISGKGTKSGWVVGGGVEWPFAPNPSVGLEYIHAEFGDVQANGEAATIPGAYPTFEGDLDIDIVRVGLNWRK
ncbi:MAG: hypothetical protein NW216_02875 [Hyphomicrobium sp.]|nr:hypothetical protein [Hyphomicrobium sp.]